MGLVVCTGFSPHGYIQYGKRFLETFHRHWPASVYLVAYTQEPVPMPRGHLRSLWDCDGAREFVLRHKDRPIYNGRGITPGWKPRERQTGYSYRFDAVKFCRQLFIPEHVAPDLEDGEILVWLDGDVVTFKDVPEGFVESLIGDGDIAYLGRGDKHPEIGFWAVRLNGITRGFLRALAAIYRTDDVFALPEWHSAYVWKHCLLGAIASGAKAVDLTPGGHGHVWFQSRLGLYTDHLKGDRKAAGRSRERTAA